MSDEEFACTVGTCDKAFATRLALQGHMTSHREPRPCPECGKQYRTAGALGNHRKNQHGIASANGSVQHRPKKNRIDLDWTTDDIMTTVVMVLWPGGSIPVNAVVPLIQWRETTREFLEKIRSE